MRFDSISHRLRPTLPWRIGLLAGSWLLLITLLHLWFNTAQSSRPVVRLGYMPVISNLAAPLLDYASQTQGDVRFEAVKFSSFAELAEALRNDRIQAAFMIAPLSIVLRQQGEDVKIIAIGNRHESTLVVRNGLNATRLSDLAGKTVAVPIRYSGHNLSLQQLLKQQGLLGRVNIVEMNPPDMAAALAAGTLDGYYVGEPFAAKTLQSGQAQLLHYVEQVWPNFICNLTLVKQRFIEQHPDQVALLVNGTARSGVWAARHPSDVARIVTEYWKQPVPLIEYALTTPAQRIRYDQFLPKVAEMQHLADLMVEFKLLPTSDISGLVEDRFAKAVNLEGVDEFDSILQ